jgi:adenylosuccinate lyase
VLLALVNAGLSREDAYRLVQGEAMAAWNDYGKPPGSALTFRQRISANPEVTRYLSAEQLDDCFDPSHHLRHLDTIYERLGLAQ